MRFHCSISFSSFLDSITNYLTAILCLTAQSKAEYSQTKFITCPVKSFSSIHITRIFLRFPLSWLSLVLLCYNYFWRKSLLLFLLQYKKIPFEVVETVTKLKLKVGKPEDPEERETEIPTLQSWFVCFLIILLSLFFS